MAGRSNRPNRLTSATWSARDGCSILGSVSSWRETLEDLRRGDIVARDRVSRLVVGVLQAMRAYQLRDSWDDLVQDVMITLLEHQPEAHDDASVAAYLRSVTTRRYFDLLRKEAGRRRNGG